MLLVKQRCYYGVEAHRFFPVRWHRYKYVWHFGEVGYEYILEIVEPIAIGSS